MPLGHVTIHKIEVQDDQHSISLSCSRNINYKILKLCSELCAKWPDLFIDHRIILSPFRCSQILYFALRPYSLSMLVISALRAGSKFSFHLMTILLLHIGAR